MAKTLETSVEISGVLSPSLQAAIKNAVNQLEEMSEETLEAAGAAERLAAEISTEESVLKSLERGYADFVVSGEESTEKAQELAEQIQKASDELNEHKGKLEAAHKASEKLASGMDKTASEADQLRQAISEQESTLEKLKERYVSLALSEDDTTGESRELAEQIQTLSNDLNENRQRLQDAENAADQLDSSLEQVDDSARLADEGFTVFKATLANLAADAIQAAIDGIKDLISNVMELGQNFTSTMSEVQAISGATGDELETLEACAREFGATTTFSASEAAEALKYMALAGWDVEQSTSALGGVLNLAAASGMELGAASDMVTDYLSAFGMEADKAGYFADLLSSAQASSNTTAEALGEAYKNCAANLNAAGQDVETVTSLLEGMANQGYKGSEAGTALAAMMRDITNGMTAAKDKTELAMYAESGLASITGDLNDVLQRNAIAIGDILIPVEDAQGNFRDLTDILLDVEKATNSMGDAERAAALSTTFTADSTKGMNLILNEGMGKIFQYEQHLRDASVTAEGFAESADELGMNLDAIKEKFAESGVSAETFDHCLDYSGGTAELLVEGLGEAVAYGDSAEEIFESLGITTEELQAVMDNAAGTAELMADTMNDNLTGDMAQMNSAWEELGLKIYERFEGPLRSATQFVTGSVIPGIEWLMGHLPELGVLFSALGAVIAGIGWKSIAQKLTMVKGAMQGVIGAIGGISAPALAVGAAIAALILAFADLWKNNEEFRAKIAEIWDGIKAKFDEFGQAITDRLNALGFEFEDITEVLSAVWNGFCELMAPVFEGAFQQISDILGVVLDVLVGLFDVFAGIFTGDWDRVWQGVEEIFGGVWDFVVNTFTNWIDTFKELADIVLGWFGSSWNETWSAVKDFFEGIWNGITSFLSGVWETIKNVVQVGIMALDEIMNVAFQLTPFQLVWQNCSDSILPILENIKSSVSGALDTIGGYMSSKMEDAKATFTDVMASISGVASTVWNAIKFATSSIWNIIANTIGSSVKSTLSTVSSVFKTIKSTVSSALNSTLGIVSTIFNSIQSAISNKINAAKDAVSSAINAIKNAFNFSWSLPELKLPHFSISGSFSLNPPSVPSFGIEWYKEGGILTQPTIFGASGNNLLAGGEAGAEAVVPLATLWEKLDTMIHEVFNNASSTGGTSDAGLTSKAGELLTLDDFSLGSLANSGGVVVYYDFSGFTWSPQIQTGNTGDRDDDFMAQLKAHEAEFFDWLEEFIQMREVAQYA